MTLLRSEFDRPRSFAAYTAAKLWQPTQNAATGYVVGNVLKSCTPFEPRQRAKRNAERPWLQSHAERENDQIFIAWEDAFASRLAPTRGMRTTRSQVGY